MQLEGPTAAGLMYSDTGGDGPVVVLLHGVLMNGTLWDTVVGGLGDRYRCIIPELPFGAHTTPMPDDAERLAEHFQNTQLVWIDNSRTLIPIDQPKNPDTPPPQVPRQARVTPGERIVGA